MLSLRRSLGRSLLGLGVILVTPGFASETPQQWYQAAQDLVAERSAQTANAPLVAKNAIVFIGDGMSLTTVSAARILEGQQRGESGEENNLSFEHFNQVALAKTYNTNQQTPDSAGTMTAISTGVKSFAGAIAVDQTAIRGDCESSRGAARPSLIDLAALSGMATGIVTTTRITHATPAALYAKAPERRWESDRGLPPTAKAQGCSDIAMQLVSYDVGRGLDLVFGGGRRAFLPEDVSDPEYPDVMGHRLDGQNLIELWQSRYESGVYIDAGPGFEQLAPQTSGPILALFQPGHMQYEYDRLEDAFGEPSLTEMVTKAIEILSNRSDEGFLLVVESGRIDHAHHANNAFRALTDTIELSRAVAAAQSAVDLNETLILVTADHAHALTFDGYGERGNPITGFAIRPGDGPMEDRMMKDSNNQPMTVLNYANGPGYRGIDGLPDNPVDPMDPDYQQKAGSYQYSSTHAGEDVPVYAIGPTSQLVYGVIEQNVLHHIILKALPALQEEARRLARDGVVPEWPVSQRPSQPEVGASP